MKFNTLLTLATYLLLCLALGSCTQSNPSTTTTTAADSSSPAGGGQSAVQDNESQKDVVKVAAGSPDHTTLVAAVKAAELVDALSNAGPFTVFAPTNAAFDKLPAGTVQDLLKPEKKADLQDILQYHVAVGVFKPELLQDGQSLSMANGGNVKIGISGGKTTVNDANVIATVPASNGIIYIIDGVLLPK